MGQHAFPAPLMWGGLGLGGMGLLVACTSYEATVDRNQVLSDLAGPVMSQTYQDFAAESVKLSQQLDQLCAAPSSETLEQARGAWRSARAPWKQAEAWGFGPVKDLRIRSDVDWFPREDGQLEALIQGSEPITLEMLELQGAGARGMLALEYVLFSLETPDPTLRLLSTDGQAVRRCELLKGLGVIQVGAAQALADAWDEGGFASALATAGQGSTVYAATQTALDEVVNGLIFVLEDVADERLGLPLGLKDGGTPHPEHVQADRSGDALRDIESTLLGFQRVYEGAADEGGQVRLGLTDLVLSRKPVIDEGVRAELQAALDAVRAIPGPLQDAVVSDPARVQAAYDALKVLHARLSADVTALLGVTLTFNDNDGD